MKKRLLALLLALVMALGMLPTAFALDADEPAGAISAGAADAETLAEGETEEEAAEPEQPEAEEPAEEPEQAGEEPAAEPEEAEEPAEEPEEAAEVATFAADTDEACAFLEGVRLENGYYTTSSTSSPYIDMSTWSATKPEGYDNYIYYENGTLTIVGEIEATVYTHEVDSSIKATLAVFSGKLTVVGDGRISLRGETIPALLVAYNAAIDFNMTPNDLKDHLIDEQIWIYSWDAMAVWGDVTISNAAKVLIETKHGYGTVLEESYNTISGNAVINGGHVTLSNETNGACVKGNLNVTADGLTIRSQENDVATLTGGNYDIATDSMSIENRCGAAVDGNIKFSEMSGHASIYGCAGDGVPLVNGNMELVNASVTMVNKNRWVPGSYDETYKVAEGCKDDGPVLVGNLTAKNKEIDYAYIELSRPSESDEPVIIGDIDLTNTLGYLRTNDGGMAMKGNKITLTDSDLGIWDYESHLEESPELVIEGCNLLMKNSSINVSERKSAWNSIEILDDYQWYAGSLDRPEVEDFKSSSKGSLNPKLVNNQRTLVINSGDKCEEPRSAEYPSNPSLDGVVGQFMQTVVAVELTGDTLELQKVPGYGYLYSSYENGEEVKHYGLPASTDLSKYLTINTPAGGVWTVTTSGRTYQGDTELPLYIIGTATTTCEDVPLEMTISGDILASGEALTVTEKNTVCWNIRASAAGVDFDNISTAEEFAKAIGGEEYAQVIGNTVTLLQNACAEKNITMTGDFTVDLNGHSISSANGQNDLTISSAKGKQTIRSNDANGKHNYSFIEAAGGELTLDTIWVGSVSALSGTLSVNRSTVISLKVSGGFTEASDSRLGFAVVDGTGDLTLRKTEITKDSTTSLRVNGGKVSIKDGTQIPCIVLVTGGEVQIDGGTFSGYEGHWLQQEGGLVSVNNGNLTGTMLVMDGELNLLGGEYSSGKDGNLGLYQSGGKVTAENVYLASTAMKEEAEDGEIYYNHRCIWLDGGELTLKNTVVTGAVFVNDGAKLEMTDSSILTVNAVALYLDSSTATLTNSRLEGQNLAVNLGGKNASVTLDGGDLRGDIWGVLVGGGSFTMLDGTINGGKTGILVTGPKCKLTVTGGEVASPEVALYAEKGNTVQLSGGTFTGAKNAIFAENGTMKN